MWCVSGGFIDGMWSMEYWRHDSLTVCSRVIYSDMLGVRCWVRNVGASGTPVSAPINALYQGRQTGSLIGY